VRNYHKKTKEQSDVARKLYQLHGTKNIVDDEYAEKTIEDAIATYESELDGNARKLLDSWDETKEKYSQEKMTFPIRNKEIEMDIVTESISGLKIPKVAFPKFEDWGERLKWLMKENVPGAFP